MSLQQPLKDNCHWLSWFIAFIAGLVAFISVLYVYETENRRYQQEVRSETLEELSNLRARIENSVSSELRLFSGLAVQLAHNPNLPEPIIRSTVNALMAEASSVSHVGISDKYILKYVFPEQGNKAAIGLNYLDNAAQREPILRAVSTRQAVLAGPATLAQGGEALLGRLPVFINANHASEVAVEPGHDFWGIISIVFDMDRLYEDIGILSEDTSLNFAIRGQDGQGLDGKEFFGDPQLFKADNPQVHIHLPGGQWVVTAAPSEDLISSFSDQRHLILYMGMLLVLLCTVAAYVLSRQFQQQLAIIDMQRESKAQILHAATYDRLTNMPNRYLFTEELEQQITLAQHQQRLLAVLFLDLDRFKDINDSFGHSVGDQFLRAFADALLDHIRETEFVARIGGDEFAIITTNISSTEQVSTLCRRIIDIMDKPFTIQNNNLNAGLSIGVAMFPQHGSTPSSLLQNADLAMYSAKQDPLDSFAFYDECMNREVQKRKALIDDIRQALAAEEFSLVYQPVVNIQDDERIVGVETLCRWQHPERGSVPPVVFIPAAELSGLIVPLGQWIMEHAGRDMAAWGATQDPNFTLSINMSPIQFHKGDPVSLAEQVLLDTGLPSHCLDIEITESTLMEDIEKAILVVNQLRDRGISVSIDDFGTGYFSLSRLRYLPVNRIKIDISFVRQIGKDMHSEAIIKAIMFLSNTLDIRTTAEGVETREQLEFLRNLGCDDVQGYYFYRPQTSTEVQRLLKDQGMKTGAANEPQGSGGHPPAPKKRH